MKKLNILLLILVIGMSFALIKCEGHYKSESRAEGHWRINVPPPPKLSMNFEARADLAVNAGASANASASGNASGSAAGSSGVYYVPNEENVDFYYHQESKTYYRFQGGHWFAAGNAKADAKAWTAVKANAVPRVIVRVKGKRPLKLRVKGKGKGRARVKARGRGNARFRAHGGK